MRAVGEARCRGCSRASERLPSVHKALGSIRTAATNNQTHKNGTVMKQGWPDQRGGGALTRAFQWRVGSCALDKLLDTVTCPPLNPWLPTGRMLSPPTSTRRLNREGRKKVTSALEDSRDQRCSWRMGTPVPSAALL